MNIGSKRKYLFLLIVALFLAAAGLLLRFLLALWGANCVVRVSFTGLDNMFHIPYEYYALDDRGAVRVPGFLAKAVLGADIEERSSSDDTETAYWFATLRYTEDELTLDRMSHLSTSFGPGYWLVYRNWTNNTPAPEEEDLALMLRAAESFYDGQGDGATALTSFMVMRNGNQYLLEERDRRLLLPLKDGGFREIMDCPEGGYFDYYFFK